MRCHCSRWVSARYELWLGKMDVGFPSPTFQFSPSHFLIRSSPMNQIFRTATFLLSGSLLLAMVGCEPSSGHSASQTSGPITKAKFKEVVNQDKLVLVKFGATWCGPCRRVDEELASLSDELPADVEVLTIDVDENPDLAQAFQISSIPRMMLVRNGELLDDQMGYMSKSQLQTWIGEHRVSQIQVNPYAQ